MTIEDRRDRDKSQMREMILNAATQIIVNEGYEKLSIRKIANQIEYSPAIIYHYFRNKDEVLSHVMLQGHKNLLSALSENQTVDTSPENRLKHLTRSYINAALQDPDQFMAVQLNKSLAVLEFTAYLFEGAAEKKPVLMILAKVIRDINHEQNVSEDRIELTAQIIAASTFGLVSKLIIEKDIGEFRRNQLIDQFTDAVVGMASLQTEAEPLKKVMKRKGKIE